LQELMKPNPQKHDAFAALRFRDYRLFIVFRFFTTIAFQMQGLIVGWQVYQLTHDPLQLGLIGLAEALPFLAVALYAGHAADRYNRKRLILLFVMLFFSGTLILLAFSHASFGLYSKYGILPIYIVVGFSGIARAFIYPSVVALIAQLVPRQHYANASTWNSTVWQIAAITGPAIGGLVYGFFDAEIAYLTVIGFVALSIVLLAAVRNRAQTPIAEDETLYRRLANGIRFVLHNQILLGSMTLDMFAVLFGGAVAVLPIFAAEVLKVGPQGLGFLRSAPMVGGVLMSIVLAYRPPAKHAGQWLFAGVTGFGLSIICFALSRNFYLSMLLLMFSGMFDNISVVIRATAMQLITPDEMRGRVASVNSLFIGSSNEIGSFESGVAAKVMGLIPSVIFGGGMTLLVVGITTRFTPLLRRLNLKAI
jgi:MFS family permease